MKAKRLAELSVLTAVSLIIFIVELQIPNPFPIPGIKYHGLCGLSLQGV